MSHHLINNNRTILLRSLSIQKRSASKLAAGTLTNPNVPSTIKLNQPYVGENAATAELLKKRAAEKKALSKEQLIIKRKLSKLEIIKSKKDPVRCWDQVSRLLDDMRITGVAPTEKIFREAINALVRAKMVDKAHSLIDRMRRSNIQVTNYMLCYMINACKFSQEPGKAQTYMNELLNNMEKEAEIQTDEQKQQNNVLLQNSFTNLINVYARVNDAANVEKVFALMKETGATPDTVTYGALLKVYGRLNRLSDALRVLDEMRTNEVDVDVITYHLLMRSCKVPEEKDQVISFFEEMKTLNMAIDATTYGTIMSKMLASDEYQAVYNYYDEFKQTKLRATPFMFSVLLKTCLKEGLAKPKLNEAQLREDAQELGVNVFILPKSDINMRRVRQYWTDMTHHYKWRPSTECTEALNTILSTRKEHKQQFKDEYKAAIAIVNEQKNQTLERTIKDIKAQSKKGNK